MTSHGFCFLFLQCLLYFVLTDFINDTSIHAYHILWPQSPLYYPFLHTLATATHYYPFLVSVSFQINLIYYLKMYIFIHHILMYISFFHYLSPISPSTPYPNFLPTSSPLLYLKRKWLLFILST